MSLYTVFLISFGVPLGVAAIGVAVVTWVRLLTSTGETDDEDGNP